MIIISVGLIIEKVRLGVRTRKMDELERETRGHFNQYLFSEIPDIDPSSEKDRYESELQPLLHELESATLLAPHHTTYRRKALLSVMLDISPNVKGETKIRTTYAFVQFGFAAKEIADTFNPNWWIRAKACKNLRVMNAASGTERLEALLSDENEDVRIEAAQSLVDIVGVNALSPILMTIRDISPWMEIRLSRSILNFSSDAIPHLAKGLKSESDRVKQFCIHMLGDIGDVYAVPVILEYINYEVPEVRHAGIVALGKLGDARAIPIIIGYAQSDDEAIRFSAAKALGNLSSPATADVLNKMLLKDTIDIRLAAAESLTKLGEIGIKTLLYSSQSDDPQTKLVTYQFLHELGYPVPTEGVV